LTSIYLLVWSGSSL